MDFLVLYLIGYVPLLLLMVFIVILMSRMKRSGGRNGGGTEGYAPAVSFAGKSEKVRVLEDVGVEAPGDIEDDYAGALFDRLVQLLEKEKLFLDPKIRITDISDRLSVSKAALSRSIKVKSSRNFCQLVHYYRVKEAMKEFETNPELSISELCEKVGFNSMTTFNTAFGRNTGFTPAEWCRDFKRKLLVQERTNSGQESARRQ